MNRLSTLLLCLTVATIGCLEPRDSNDDLSEAIPTSETLRINLPADSGTEQTAIGEISELYAMTRGATRMFNGGATFVLVLVHAVVQLPPTTIEENVYTWGPGSDPLDPADYRLVVTDNLDGTYVWALDGRSKFDDAAEFITAASGVAVAGTEANRGSGEFVLHLDNMKALDPIAHNDSDSGSVTVNYDLENRDGTQASIEIDINTVDADDAPLAATYYYAENVDRSGDFQFVVPDDVDDDGSALETVTLRSRWLNNGSGRADARVEGGDMGDEVAEFSQCWNTQFRTVYEISPFPWAPEAGANEDCAFLEQDLPDL